MSEAANTVTAEGRTVRAAVELAAAELGVDFSRVAHKLDASHFRGPDGRPRAVDTVKVIAWVREGEPEPAPRPAPREDRRDDRRDDRRERDERPARDDRRERDERPARDEHRERPRRDRDEREPRRDRDEREPRRERRPEAPAALTEGPASAAAKAWVETLLQGMDVEGSVRAGVHEGSDLVEVFIDSPSARHLVGRRGITLHAIRHLLEAAMSAEHSSWRFDISVDGGDRGPREERFDERPRRDDRGDRGDRGDRPRRDDRGDRGDRPRRDDRGGDRRDDRRASDRDIDKLRGLARRLAEEARDTGKPVRFRKEMNSYERRMVHMELQDFPGVRTESEGDGQMKTIVILPAGAPPAEE
ncbi:MAG: hypothetical protein JNM72_05025 [Deltaproteobacteria bacterium]|nr:hypothetical protein [Deltaproteobacteria bacterium]